MLLFVAGAAFGGVGLSLFLAGATFGEILIDSRSAKCCIFPYKMRLQGGIDSRSAKLCIFPYKMRRRDGTGKLSEAAGAR